MIVDRDTSAMRCMKAAKCISYRLYQVDNMFYRLLLTRLFYQQQPEVYETNASPWHTEGLVAYRYSNGHWQLENTSFEGVPVSIAYADPRNGTWWAALDHGHWGVKLCIVQPTVVPTGKKLRPCLP